MNTTFQETSQRSAPFQWPNLTSVPARALCHKTSLLNWVLSGSFTLSHLYLLSCLTSKMAPRQIAYRKESKACSQYSTDHSQAWGKRSSGLGLQARWCAEKPEHILFTARAEAGCNLHSMHTSLSPHSKHIGLSSLLSIHERHWPCWRTQWLWWPQSSFTSPAYVWHAQTFKSKSWIKMKFDSTYSCLLKI